LSEEKNSSIKQQKVRRCKRGKESEEKGKPVTKKKKGKR